MKQFIKTTKLILLFTNYQQTNHNFPRYIYYSVAFTTNFKKKKLFFDLFASSLLSKLDTYWLHKWAT